VTPSVVAPGDTYSDATVTVSSLWLSMWLVVVVSKSAVRATSEVDEVTRQTRLQRRRIMEKERRKAIQAARRRLRQAQLNRHSSNSVRIR